MKEGLLDRNKIKNDEKMQYIIYCIMFIILLIPNIFTLIYATDLRENLVMMISYLGLSIAVWLLPLLLFNFKNYFRLGFVLFLLSPIEIIFVQSTGLPANIGFLETVFNTNYQETKEQVFSNIPILVLFIVLGGFYLYLLTFINTKNLNRSPKIALISVFLIINIVLFFNVFSIIKTYIPKDQRIEVAFENTLKKYHKIFPVNIILNGISAIKTNNSNKKFEKDIDKFSFKAKQISNIHEDELYILVIGETARRHNFHLYGYPRNTTPELNTIKNLVPFTDVNSAATLTLLSIPQIITRASPEQFDLQYKEKTIVDVFHQAGFYTAWIGVQNISTPLVQRLKSVCDYTFFSKSDSGSGQFYDGDVLKNVQQIIADKTHRKKLIVIHSLGSHFRYSNRYPSDFAKFTPTISSSGYSDISLKHKTALVNSYDNSILYTDYFLSSVIKLAEKTNSISGLIYLSDHGENLYDDGKTIFHGGEKPTPYEYEIPFLVWYSQEYKALYPEKVDALKLNKDKKATSTATFYSLADMANISYLNSKNEIYKSILHIHYKAPLVRKLMNSKKEVISTN